jgi:hypothetical protein
MTAARSPLAADDPHFCAIEQAQSDGDDEMLRDFGDADAGADNKGQRAVTSP